MRNKMIIKLKNVFIFEKFLKEMYRDKSGEFVSGHWGLKG